MKNQLIFSLILSFAFSNSMASKRYVTPGGTGNYSGSSWGNASNDIQAMINASTSGDEVWVKYGTYYPTAYPTDCNGCSSSRDYTFFMKSGVSVYGQFAGTESNINQRVLGAGQSVLSGDLTNDGLISNNAYHVVSFIKLTTAPYFDGFTVKDGNANVNSNITANYSSSAYTQSYNRSWGGGILTVNSAAVISNCHILNNYATSGGGMLNSNALNRVGVFNSIFVGNAAEGGGAIYNHDNSLTAISRSTITNNYAAVAGGAMYNYNGSNPVISNTIIWNNTSPTLSGIANNGGTPAVSNSIIQNGNSPCTNCPNTNGNIDPLFKNIANPRGVDNIWGSADDGLELSLNSPAMETASGSEVPGTDLTGQTRHYDSPFRYNNPSVFSDIGAYENHDTNPILIFVNGLLATGANDGTSWANAFRGSAALQSAITASQEGNDIWVRAGTYKPTAYPVGCTGCSSNRDYTFHLKDGVKLFGGFVGYETDIIQRNINIVETILSGDINTIGLTTDNVRHVIISTNVREMTTIDGFTIRDGGDNANYGAEPTITVNSYAIPFKTGGGMHAKASKINILNTVFKNNNAIDGGGVYHSSSYFSRFTNCKFLDNSATSSGGAFYSLNNSDLELSSCVFKSNYAFQGGAINNSNCDFKMSNCILNGNISPYAGYSSVLNNVSCSPSIINCTIIGNITTNPTNSTMSFFNSPNFIIKNTIIWANVAGAVIQVSGGASPIISNSIFQGGFTPCTSCPNTNGNIDPKLAIVTDGDGLDDKWGTFDDGFQIIASSPAFNAGTNTGAPPFDYVGNTNIGANKDIGAYAFKLLEFCLDNQLIAERPLNSGNYGASVRMISTANIPNSSIVNLESAHQVLLLPGFKADNGAIFTAKIGPDCILSTVRPWLK